MIHLTINLYYYTTTAPYILFAFFSFFFWPFRSQKKFWTYFADASRRLMIIIFPFFYFFVLVDNEILSTMQMQFKGSSRETLVSLLARMEIAVTSAAAAAAAKVNYTENKFHDYFKVKRIYSSISLLGID